MKKIGGLKLLLSIIAALMTTQCFILAAAEQPVARDMRLETNINTPIDNLALRSAVDPANYSGDLTFKIISIPTKGKLYYGDDEIAKEELPYLINNPNPVLRYIPNPAIGTTPAFRDLDSFTFGCYARIDGQEFYSNGATVAIGVGIDMDPPAPRTRKQEWSAKETRTLYTGDQIRDIRDLCVTNTDAGAIKQKCIDDAQYWIRKSDEELRNLLPDGSVPRAHTVSNNGCPRHGKAIYNYGDYPWILDRERPFFVKCPVGREEYPNNDYVDPGRGWVPGPGGILSGGATDTEKYWFVGYACHWHWRNTWIPAVVNLARAYLLTGDRVYADKAIVMLDRIAEIYPGMNHSTQSRMGEIRNGGYKGKILNYTWETFILADLAVAYDMVFDTLIDNNPISLPWRNSEQIRENIEANLLEEGIDAVYQRQIIGNLGMHQRALAYAVLVRDPGNTNAMAILDTIFNSTGYGPYSPDVVFDREQGFDYALYNMVFKDGLPFETSPSYNAMWVDMFVQMPWEKMGAVDSSYSLYNNPKFKMMFDAPLELIVNNKFVPANGDSGRVSSTWLCPTKDPETPGKESYKEAYKQSREPKYAWAAGQMGGFEKQYSTFDNLFYPADAYNDAVSAANTYNIPAPQSRFLDGYGMAILNNSNNTFAASIYYGARGPHGHYDRLNIELFGHGFKLSPDLGYPDSMATDMPGVFAWSKNTISHNTVMVDEKKQTGNDAGVLLRFHDTADIDVVDVDAGSGRAYAYRNSGTYIYADKYRRTLIMVEAGYADAYMVDVFRVKGRAKNDRLGGLNQRSKNYILSLHGNEGAFELSGTSLGPPAETAATVASSGLFENTAVRYGQLYDENVALDRCNEYFGSGLQHLVNYQTLSRISNVISGTWRLDTLPDATAEPTLRVYIAPPYNSTQDLIVADGPVSPRSYEAYLAGNTRDPVKILKYILLKRSVANVDNDQGETFVNVWEPIRPSQNNQIISRVAVLSSSGNGADQTVALSISRADGITDEITISPERGLNGAVRLLRKDNAGAVIRGFSTGGDDRMVTGTISSAVYNDKKIIVDLNANRALFDANNLKGRAIRIYNDKHSCVYKIAAAEMGNNNLTLTLTGSDIITGRVKIDSVNATAKTITTSAYIPFPLNRAMSGMRLISDDYNSSAFINSISEMTSKVPYHTISLRQNTQDAPVSYFLTGQNAWIADFGAGDSIEIEQYIDSVNKPLINSLATQTVSEGQTLTFTVSARHPYMNNLRYSAANLPRGAVFVGNSDGTATFSWPPDFTQQGNYNNIVFTASDGALSDSTTVSINVINVNQPPQAVSVLPNSSSFAINSPCTFTTVISDPDGASNIAHCQFVIGADIGENRAFYAAYNHQTNKLLLKNDSGTLMEIGSPGGAPALAENSYCILYPRNTTVSVAGNSITVNWSVTFKGPMAGTKKIYLKCTDVSRSDSGWQQRGAINISSSPSTSSAAKKPQGK